MTNDGSIETQKIFPENFSLYINELRIQNAISWEITWKNQATLWFSEEFVVTLRSSNRRTCASLWADTHFWLRASQSLHPGKRKTKSEEWRRFSSAAKGGSQFKSRFPIKGHERNKWTIKSEECHSAHGSSPMVQTQIFHSSLLTLHSLAAPLQIRTKFAANPIPEWEIEGRQWAVTTNPSGDYRLRRRDKGWVIWNGIWLGGGSLLSIPL